MSSRGEAADIAEARGSGHSSGWLTLSEKRANRGLGFPLLAKIERLCGGRRELCAHARELLPQLRAAAEAKMLEARAQAGHHRARRFAAIENRSESEARMRRLCLIDDRFEPERPCLQRRARRARERDRQVHRSGGVKYGARLRERMNDDLSAHPSLPTSAAASTMRLEKPHSLSYQDMTRQKRLSITWVCVRSKVELCESWLKSLETTSSLVTARMPRKRLEPAAFSISALISFLSVSRAAVNFKSIIETLGVGTRIDVPSSLPWSVGMTSPNAFAAPVEVGIMLIAAARARRISLCSVSTVFWSPV